MFIRGVLMTFKLPQIQTIIQQISTDAHLDGSRIGFDTRNLDCSNHREQKDFIVI